MLIDKVCNHLDTPPPTNDADAINLLLGVPPGATKSQLVKVATMVAEFALLIVEEVAAPEPGPGEVSIAVAAAGANFADVLMVAGKYQEKPDFPFSPGLEVAGTVVDCGDGVAGFAPGDRVLAVTGHGGFTERVTAQHWKTFLFGYRKATS